jgi:hypothetical protein
LEMEIFWEVENFDSNVSMPCAIYCCHNWLITSIISALHAA